MLKEATKLFSRSISILIFILLGQINGFAQNVNENIDISEEFKKIEKYNEHIKTANYYHHIEHKIIGKKVGLFFVGLAGVVGAIVLLTNNNENVQVVGGAGGGGAIAILVIALENRGSYNYDAEQKELEKAKALFKNIPNKRWQCRLSY